MTNWRFGRHPTVHDYRTLRFSTYAASLPAPPAEFDSKARVYAAIGESDAAQVFPMDGNDSYGDCTIAARAHADTIWQAFTGAKVIGTKAWCLRLYFRLTGGVDSGLNLLTVLRNWKRVVSDQILAYVSIDPANHTHMQQAIALFGCVYVGFQCQKDIIQEFDAHTPWVPGPLENDGHSVVFTGYTGSGSTDLINLLTWGSDAQQGQWAWWDEVSGSGRGEAYAIVPKAAQNPAFAPGFDITQLLADLAAVAG
jgi:hypothetical protein